jgi:predicted O-linked N-acetylglucosamine transferase (SPINDLY family)
MEEPALEALKKAITLAPQHLATLQNHARWLIRKNHFSQALGLINQALTIDPNHIETLEIKAHVLLSLHELQSALEQINVALALQENRLSALALRATIYMYMGEFKASLEDANVVAQKKSHWILNWITIATSYHYLGKNELALSAVQQGLKINSSHPILINQLGEFLIHTHRNDEAVEALNKAVLITPDSSVSWLNLGAALQNIGEYNESLKAYEKSLSLNPFQAKISENLGSLAIQKQHWEQALIHYNNALQLNQNDLNCLLGKGLALNGLTKHQNEVENIIHQLQNAAPNMYMAYFLLGNYLRTLGQLKKALIYTKKAFELAPKNTHVLNFYADILKELGELNSAEQILELLLKINPNEKLSLSILTFIKTYNNKHTPQSILKTASEFNKIVSRHPVVPNKHAQLIRNSGENPVKLKVGFVSGDFRNHPVGYFTCSVLQELFGRKIELHAYSNNTTNDELTSLVKPCFESWNDISSKNDKEVQYLIETEGIHILVDLSGHSAFNRLPLFAKKPAPVQATWLGFLATTGLTEMDWLIGDDFVTPVEDESHFSEKIWRMPENYACFTEPKHVPEVNELPALTNSFITFGSFNNLTKMTDEVVRVWARLLLSIPDSRLFLKYTQLNFSETIESTQARFSQHGIVPERLILEGSSPRSELLASYQRVDIALDPFPYGGGTTSFEALYMGVPILNIHGDRFLSRVGTCVMHFIGHPEFSAKDENDFIQKGIELTNDLHKLAETRRHLREKGLKTSLFNANRFAAQLEQAFFDMWQHHLNQLETPS